MRAMQHNSRANASGGVHGAKHNDRNFDVTQADNIDSSRSDQNVYWHCYPGEGLTFEAAELKFYEEHFGDQLQKTNDAYIRNGHPERCRSMEDWKKVKRNAPEETVLQVGNIEEHIDRDQLLEAYLEYNARMEDWNRAHGCPYTQLNYALHADEAVPHIQARRVWHYTDKDGILKIGQEKALAAAGVPLPHPDQAPGRHNNRKMVFDQLCREKWLEVLHDRGLDVERTPIPDGKHNLDKQDMIREQNRELVKENAALMGTVKPPEEIEAIQGSKTITGKVAVPAADYAVLEAAARATAAYKRELEKTRAENKRLLKTNQELEKRQPSIETLINQANEEKEHGQLRIMFDRLVSWAVDLWDRFVAPLRRLDPNAWTFDDARDGWKDRDPKMAASMEKADPMIQEVERVLGGKEKCLNHILERKGMHPLEINRVLHEKFHQHRTWTIQR